MIPLIVTNYNNKSVWDNEPYKNHGWFRLLSRRYFDSLVKDREYSSAIVSINDMREYHGWALDRPEVTSQVPWLEEGDISVASVWWIRLQYEFAMFLYNTFYKS